MPRNKITIAGKLSFSEDEGLTYSLPIGKPPNQPTLWLKAGLENADDWPRLGNYPESPEKTSAPSWRDREAFQRWSANKTKAEEDWKKASAAYETSRDADPDYRQAEFDLMELECREPQPVPKPFAVLVD